MKLQIGTMSLRELSEWFGLKPDTFAKSSSATKKKKLEILKSFADYHFEGKKIYIDKVYIEEYSKAYQIIEKQFDKEWGNSGIEALDKEKIDTCKRVSSVIYEKNPQIKKQVSSNTSYAYTCKVKRDGYGRAYVKDDMGSKGYCEYVWMNETNTAPLDKESLKILKDCANEAYKGVHENIAEIDAAFHRGEINSAERAEALGLLNSENAFLSFRDLVTMKLGFFPNQQTKLQDMVKVEELK